MIKNVKMRDGNELAVAVIPALTDRKNKPWVVMVHGIGGSHHMWVPFALPFYNKFNFIIPNLRGFGLSADVPYNNNSVIHNYAEDIEDCVDALVPKDNKVILIALSMGAYSSMQYLKNTNGDRVEKYLNIDQSPKAINSENWNIGLVGEKQAFLIPRLERLVSEALKNNYYEKNFNELPAHFRAEYQKCLCEFFTSAVHRQHEKLLLSLPIYFGVKIALNSVSAHKLSSYADCLLSYIEFDYDFRDVFNNLNIPVTLFIGKHSEMYPADGQRAIAAISKNCNTVEFDESHALMYTAPLKFLKELKKFLNE